MLIDKEALFQIDYYKTPVPCECKHCKSIFYVKAALAKSYFNGSSPLSKIDFCSNKCKNNAKNTLVQTNCKNCNTMLTVRKKVSLKNNFCSQSCAAIYNNAHKGYGYHRSKLEVYIEDQLKKDFPNLKILFNDTNVIKRELDIYIPALHLAFEINGIFHYEPIFNPNTLTKTQNRDNQKLIECYKHDIELIVIDTSKQKYFTEKSSIEYYLIIKKMIELNIGRSLHNSNATT